MLESAWLFIGVIATLSTIFAVSTQSSFARMFPDDDAVAIMAGIVGFVSWAVWTYGSLNVEVVTDSGVEVFGMPSVTFLGIALSLVPGYIALTGPADIIRRHKEPDAKDL